MSAVSTTDWAAVRRDFLLAPDEVYLNAGTFSALPRPVFDELQELMRSAEANPTRLAAWRKREPFWAAQAAVAAYIGADARDVALQTNVTEALSQALLGSRWRSGGELLIGSREYGAIVNAARAAARRHGLTVRQLEIPAVAESAEAYVDLVLDALGEGTRGVLLSHILCGTGTVLPVARIATALRARGVRLIVDGAHGPGLVPLALGGTDIDVYGGNLHKWFMGPKGTAFLYVRRAVQTEIDPQVVGFGGSWHDGKAVTDPCGEEPSRFAAMFSVQGLRDASPFLALPAVLRYRERIGEAAIMARIAALSRRVRERFEPWLPCLSPAPPLHAGLTTFRLPAGSAAPALLQDALFERHRVTVAIWAAAEEGGAIMRVSAHVWNDEADIDRLGTGLADLVGRRVP